MKILKFGGTSLATPDAVRRAVHLVAEAHTQGPVAVVVSAFGGVTNDLLAAADAAAARDDGYQEIWSRLEQRHLSAAEELAPGEAAELTGAVRQRFGDLHDLLHGVFLLRECSPRTRDGIASYGERLAARLVAAALRAAEIPAQALDARRLIVTDDTFGQAWVDAESSYRRIRERLAAGPEVAVITGFLGATPEGRTTTLGRGGSDYTAALVGAAVAAEAIELWTDVDGVLSADPRLVPGAFPQPLLSYAELMELSHFGAEVVHPPSVHPAKTGGVPLVIKNTFRPEAPGTRVMATAPAGTHPIRGISSIHRVALLRLEGDGMVGVPGIARRLFGALSQERVSAILISQGSSEHSICFAVDPEDAERARTAVDREFAFERQAGAVDRLVVETGRSVIAAVGEGMRELPGIAGRIFSVLGHHRINVRAVAQGSSELNVSLVVDGDDEAPALNAIHDAFFAPRRRRIAVALAGVGRVGATLLEQLRETAAGLAERDHLEVRPVALVTSRHMLLEPAGVDPDDWRPRLEAAPAPDLDELRAFLDQHPGDLRVFVDCTASEAVTGWYRPLLADGVAVVAANKLAFAGPLELYRALRRTEAEGGGPLFFEATVGAGLPVLGTLASLRRTGHRIERIEGILSGTVNAVLDRIAKGIPFSEAVRSAHEEGLTEPNPYEDLSGADVLRKVCILARLADRPVELEEVASEPLIPAEPWGEMELDELWRRLPELDDHFASRQREAAADGGTLRYVASITAEGAQVELRAVPPEHPAHGLAGPDNLIAFTTQHYRDTPLVIRGPGAGPAVTASGVFADVLQAAIELDLARP